MQVIPAVDLRNGKCVRLIQGQYDKQITYGDDPVEPAREFAQAGAQLLHVIDLDGAKEGTSVNRRTVKRIVDSVDIRVEIGGGIRTEESIRDMLETIGVERIILGTAALKNFAWFEKMTKLFPGKLVLSIDAKGANVATDGWLEQTGQTLIETARRAAALPLTAIIYTDIDKDGMLAGPNIERTRALVEAVDVDIVAAGGVTQVTDVIRLAEIGVAGAVVGRALYEGTFDLREAIEIAKGY